MQNTPWSDGVPGLNQTPIEPGERYVYRFTAYPAGGAILGSGPA
jgi:FtsP/CotA-like multicopper oxidase with cupredoxin domain